MKIPTQSRLKQLLSYDPETGQFLWQELRGNAKAEYVGVNCNGYRRICVDGVRYFAHRLVWLYVYGEYPEGGIDHINRNKTDNRIANLRLATPAQNGANKTCAGVWWHKKNEKWVAMIQRGGAKIYLGSFVTRDQATAARDLAARQKDGEFFAPSGLTESGKSGMRNNRS
jgi:hypothetical protein